MECTWFRRRYSDERVSRCGCFLSLTRPDWQCFGELGSSASRRMNSRCASRSSPKIDTRPPHNYHTSDRLSWMELSKESSTHTPFAGSSTQGTSGIGKNIYFRSIIDRYTSGVDTCDSFYMRAYMLIAMATKLATRRRRKAFFSDVSLITNPE